MSHEHLLPFITVIADKEIVFQQANAIIVKDWLENFGIKLHAWLAFNLNKKFIETSS